jgi:hypothetical protein
MINRMKRSATTLAAVVVTLGSVSMATIASAAAISDGSYVMSIEVTPTIPGTSTANVGVDGAYNSSFTTGGVPLMPSSGVSQGLTDNGETAFGYGSGIAADGVAGKLGISVAGGNISFNSFSVDSYLFTCCGTWAQDVGASGSSLFSGTTNAADTTFDLTGREATISISSAFGIKKWDYASFTTGTASSAAGTVHGTAVTAVGDVNGDGLTDYTATFVSAGIIGPEWSSLSGVAYYEIWKVQINSVPLPAGVWLLGSGLLGLLGAARRNRFKAGWQPG